MIAWYIFAALLGFPVVTAEYMLLQLDSVRILKTAADSGWKEEWYPAGVGARWSTNGKVHPTSTCFPDNPGIQASSKLLNNQKAECNPPSSSNSPSYSCFLGYQHNTYSSCPDQGTTYPWTWCFDTTATTTKFDLRLFVLLKEDDTGSGDSFWGMRSLDPDVSPDDFTYDWEKSCWGSADVAFKTSSGQASSGWNGERKFVYSGDDSGPCWAVRITNTDFQSADYVQSSAIPGPSNPFGSINRARYGYFTRTSNDGAREARLYFTTEYVATGTCPNKYSISGDLAL